MRDTSERLLKYAQQASEAITLLREATDKIDGLESDLYEAVRIAFKYGAKGWVKMNYPDMYKALEGGDALDQEAADTASE